MDATKVFQHQDYELQCSAKRLDGQRFAAALVIVKQVWPTRPRDIAVERADFATAEEAIDAAHAQGLTWIHNYG